MRSPTFEEIGARIRACREEKGLSQSSLAKALGISRPVVTKIEKGGKAINSVEIRGIADFLDTSVDDLTRSVNDKGLVALFREQKQDAGFLESVSVIEDLARDLIGQMRLKAKYDGCR
jgi:transcriptional regulator with XRE-family HTH domain